MKLSKAELNARIVDRLRREPGLTLDVLRQKVAPDRKNIYYYVQGLRSDGVLVYQEKERPIRLYLTERPPEAPTALRLQTPPPVRPTCSRFQTVPPVDRNLEIRSLHRQLSQMRMELALLQERLTQLQEPTAVAIAA